MLPFKAGTYGCVSSQRINFVRIHIEILTLEPMSNEIMNDFYFYISFFKKYDLRYNFKRVKISLEINYILKEGRTLQVVLISLH